MRCRYHLNFELFRILFESARETFKRVRMESDVHFINYEKASLICSPLFAPQSIKGCECRGNTA